MSRHETFTPRYGWLKKGYEAAISDGRVFIAQDAIERLGVGKNMVRSIRSWCLAFHLLEPCEGEGKKGVNGALQPTQLGNRLLADDGWDPYLEDLGSLWLLHWQLFVPPIESASWSLAFNHCVLPAFDRKHLARVLVSAAQQYDKLSALSESSFDNDASCLIRMYTGGKVDPTVGIDCPFTQLNIIRTVEESNTFRFVTAEKQTLPSLIFAACCFSYANLTQPNQKTLSLHKIVYEFNSPGVVFKLSEMDAGRLLDDAAAQMQGVDFMESVGNRQLLFNENPIDLFWHALELYYADEEFRGAKK
ncbi:MAG: DUF4007 family protein [bacterium]